MGLAFKTMKFSKSLHCLTEKDPKITQIPELVIGGTYNDKNHAQRRMQQRAINRDMIKVTIAYGKYKIHSKALTWTMLDKCLRNTRYESLVSNLRGLRIIAQLTDIEQELFIITVYWVFKLAN